MTVYIGSLVCNFTTPKFPEKGTKEYDDFLKELDNEPVCKS